jgi:hypothetical protein
MLLTLFDPSQQLCRQGATFVATAVYFGLSRRRRFTFEELRAHFHLAIADSRKHADWKIAVTVEPTQKFSLCVQTKQRFAIVYRIEKRACALIVTSNLESNYSLTACG